jgi:N-methylhydantoinase A/oxoprolinase/acetone carboxylase beta subunit
MLEIVEKAAIDPTNMDFFAHGTTVIINALTERKGAKTGLITTAGFRDMLEIGRGNRPDFFNLQYVKPKPSVCRVWTAIIAHMTDIGGKMPGGLATDATEIFQEGVVLPLVRLIDRGTLVQSVFDILKAKSRMPDFLRRTSMFI